MEGVGKGDEVKKRISPDFQKEKLGRLRKRGNWRMGFRGETGLKTKIEI